MSKDSREVIPLFILRFWNCFCLSSIMAPFGLPCFESIDSDRRASKELDKKIAHWMKQYNKSIKLLLLGAGESGKTTIIKQMKILHVQGFSEEERKEKVLEIRQNLFESMREITMNMKRINPPIEPSNPESEQLMELLSKIDLESDVDICLNDNFEVVRALWSDEGIKSSLKRSNEFQLLDCAQYFLDRIDLIRCPDFSPSDQDILRSRKRTTEIQKIEFTVKVSSKYGGGSQSFWMFDVGGQRGERRKWIQVFDGISAVLFLVESSGFDTKIREDDETNRLEESLNLFQEVWSSRFLRESGFIIFLNKQDILKEKLNRGSRLEDHFPDFVNYQPPTIPSPSDSDDPEKVYERARSFIRDKFMAITKKPTLSRRVTETISIQQRESRSRDCFCHFTTATDTDNIKKVFDAVHIMIIMSNLQKISLT